MSAALVCQLQTEMRMQRFPAPRRATKERFARRHDTLDRFLGAAIVILFPAVRRLDQWSSRPRNEFGLARGARAVSAVF
jgi:hypothetical protein